MQGRDVLEFADSYALLVESLMKTYPCADCRLHTLSNSGLQHAVTEVRRYTAGLWHGPVPQPREVADALAIHAFRIHNLVSASVNSTDEPTRIQKEMMCGFMNRMDSGDLSVDYVASLLRERWSCS